MKFLDKKLSKSAGYLGLAFLVCMTLPSLYSAKKDHIKQPKKEIWINVFVHGIMSIKPHVGWNNFMRFMKDDVENTLYEKTVGLMRDDPFFFKNQAMQQIGLHRVDHQMFQGNSSASMAFIMDEIGNHYGINRNNYYYTYGWSGLMSAKMRYRDSKKLFEQLQKEVAQFKKQNIIPRVRIIGYSHGGNVGLNLGAVHQKHHKKSKLIIDELVLLGTPIIADTDHLINDSIFKKVYNLYSEADRVQPLDFFAPRQLFSNRIFRPRKDFELPNKLRQIRLKVTRSASHITSDSQKFKHSYNLESPTVVYGKSRLLRDISPGHAELWFFGWTPVNYRSHYPLYPLPTASFIPAIVYHAEKMAPHIGPENSIIADIRPEHDVMLFRQHNKHEIHSSVAYVPKEKLNRMHEAVLECKPELYTHKLYKSHIQDAVERAQAFMEKAEAKINEMIDTVKQTFHIAKN